jgi:hypothetical protein
LGFVFWTRNEIRNYFNDFLGRNQSIMDRWFPIFIIEEKSRDRSQYYTRREF